MPLYTYYCVTCEKEVTLKRSIFDETRPVCDKKHKKLQRIYTTPAVAFKGSGFTKSTNPE